MNAIVGRYAPSARRRARRRRQRSARRAIKGGPAWLPARRPGESHEAIAPAPRLTVAGSNRPTQRATTVTRSRRLRARRAPLSPRSRIARRTPGSRGPVVEVVVAMALEPNDQCVGQAPVEHRARCLLFGRRPRSWTRAGVAADLEVSNREHRGRWVGSANRPSGLDPRSCVCLRQHRLLICLAQSTVSVSSLRRWC